MAKTPAPTTTIGAIASAVQEVTGLIRELFAGKAMARLQYRVEAGVHYVLVDKRAGEYEGISDKKQADLKVHFSKRIFDEN